MLNALKQQLVHLSQEDDGRFLSALKKRVGTSQAKLHVEPLKNFILVMPEMISQISVWSEEDRVPAEVRRLHGYVLTYLYHPVDFLHDEGYGLFGYLDDAYVVGSAYQATISQIPKEKRKHLPHHKDLAEQLENWLSQVRSVLPKETVHINKMMSDLLKGEEGSFQNIFSKNTQKKAASK